MKKELNKQKIIDNYCLDEETEFMFMDGFDEAILGVVESFGSEQKVCYDKNKVIEILEKQGMTYEEAFEWFDYNIIGAYVGEKTPVFMESINDI